MIKQALAQTTPRSTRGMSLIELLIAMTLGLFLMAGMITVLSGNKRSSELNSAMANMQETARFVLNILSDDIRVAGYQGCLNPMHSMMKVRAASSPVPRMGVDPEGEPIHNFNLSSATGSLVVENADWNPAIFGDFDPPDDNEAIPGTHALAVQFGSRRSSRIVGPISDGGTPSPNGDIVTTNNLDLEVGDLAIISNCDIADMFEVTGTTDTGAGQTLEHSAGPNLSGSFDGYYGRPNNIAMTRVMRFISNIYYVADTGLENNDGDPIRALYQQSYPYNDADNPATEIAQGIENIRFNYGIRTEDGLAYVAPDDPNFDAELVESIQIGLMMTSWDAIAEQDDTNTYIVAGQAIAPSEDADDGLTHARDKRFRLVFNTTVNIRNRLTNSILTNKQNAGT